MPIDQQLRVPPPYCQYASGPCDQSFQGIPSSQGLFLYGSKPENIAAAIESAIESARGAGVGEGWRSWKDLPISGQIIFCEICKAMRFSGTLVADVTTLNFNLLFEIGFGIGLGVPLIPIRDTTYMADKRDFEELAVLQTLGYVDFTNGANLLAALAARLPGDPLPRVETDTAVEAPLYVLKGPIETEGAISLMSAIKKSRIKFRTYDPVEVPRLSLGEARKQVGKSVGVIAHLLSPKREGARVHNALCAFVSGLAMAQKRIVLMLQEETVRQPIDYRDVVLSYENPRHIVGLIEQPLLRIYDAIQTKDRGERVRPANILQQLDLGDIAAENEISGLDEYFVETGQYLQAKQGHARLVIGRKGSGKTAIFYGIRDPLIGTPSRLIADLRPEGYQFTKLREFVLSRLSPGLQEHTMMSFWHYLLITELARKILVADRSYASRAERRWQRFQEVDSIYGELSPDFESDFAQRLLFEVDRVVSRLGGLDLAEVGPRLTEYVFTGTVKKLEQAVIKYLEEKEEVWLLLDNLDKSWPTHGSTDEDILIVRALLEATRKLQQRLGDQGVEFRCLVFLRTDIYEHLLRATPDKGKDTAISLEWEDSSIFEEIVRRRIEASTRLDGEFRDVWSEICESHIKVQDTFDYLVERTLMRPRDLLLFLRRCVEVAINRGHDRIDIEDILMGERSYSEDILFGTAFEIADTHPEWQDVLYAFQGSKARLNRQEVEEVLLSAGIPESQLEGCSDLLLRFGFLGVAPLGSESVMYGHLVHYNMRRLWDPILRGQGALVVHPAFREALDISQ
jgi:hypothetical protein